VASNSKEANLIGLGLDTDDGHVRITHGKNFQLFGGSQGTHERMQEACIKFNEKLDMRGKRLEDLNKTELCELAAECDMNRLAIPRSQADEGSN